jgi:hypothetical protein
MAFLATVFYIESAYGLNITTSLSFYFLSFSSVCSSVLLMLLKTIYFHQLALKCNNSMSMRC